MHDIVDYIIYVIAAVVGLAFSTGGMADRKPSYVAGGIFLLILVVLRLAVTAGVRICVEK